MGCNWGLGEKMVMEDSKHLGRNQLGLERARKVSRVDFTTIPGALKSDIKKS